jgi:hypothetical protein
MAEAGSSSTGISDYEKRRNENIERNAKYLAELGLASNGSTKRSLSGVASSGSAKSSKRSGSSKKNESDNVTPFVELRRSSRVAALEPVSYKEVSLLWSIILNSAVFFATAQYPSATKTQSTR